MAEIPPGPTEPLDVQRIHYLARLMKRYDLSSLDLADGPVQIRLRRRGPEIAATAAGCLSQPPRASPAAPHRPRPPPRRPRPPAAAAAGREGALHREPHGRDILYVPRPDAPPLVTVGSVVHPGTIVCIIEAMKVFTDIPAGVSGTIVEVLAKNGQAVEYGQPLFRVTPA